MPAPETLRRQALTLLTAALGGAALALPRVPLAWMIGAMLATAALGWHRPGAVAAPPWARPAAMVVLGLAFGQSFSGPVLAAVTGALPVLALSGLLTIASGLLVARLFTRLAGTDARTGFFCAVPGGIVVMAMLAQEAGASVATVTLAQTLRVLVVVLTFPPLLGWLAPHGDAAAFTAPPPPFWPPGLGLVAAGGLLLGWPMRRLGLANPWMLGPCFLAMGLAASGHLPSGVPRWLVNAAQVGMGATLGMRLNRGFLLASRRLALASVLSAAVLSLLLAVLAVAIGWAARLPVAAMILGLAPGGMPEMALTAQALELAVPLVLGFHLVRTVLCNLLVGPIYRVGARLGAI